MEKHKIIRNTMFIVVAVDTSVIVTTIPLSHLIDLRWLAIIYIPVLLIFHVMLLRHRLSAIAYPSTGKDTALRFRKRSLSLGSFIYFAGTLYGLFMVLIGALPWVILPVLLVPLSVAIYCLRAASKAGGTFFKP